MLEIEKTIETAETAERNRLTAKLSGLTETAARITIRDLTASTERTVETGAIRKNAVRLAADGVVLFSGSDNGTVEQIYIAQNGAPPPRQPPANRRKCSRTSTLRARP